MKKMQKKINKKISKINSSVSHKVIFSIILLVVSLFVISFIYKNESDQKINANESKEQNEHNDNNNKNKFCPPDYKHNIWKICHYGKPYYNKQQCRQIIQQFKEVLAPTSDDDHEWYEWARRGPKSLECGIACEVAPSLCSGSPTPGASTTPNATPTDVSVTGSVTPVITQGPATAPYLLFNPLEQNLQVGEEFDANVMVDTLDSETLGTDAYVVYDPTLLQPVTTTQGDFYPTITTSNLTSSVVLRGIVTEPADSRKGAGSLGTIRYKTLKKGATTLQYYCNPVAGDTSKIVQNNIDASNIINCGDNRSLAVNIGVTSATGTASITPSSAVSPSSINLTITNIPKGKLSKSMIAIIILIFIIMMIILGL